LANHSVTFFDLASENDQSLINAALVKLRQVVPYQQIFVAVFNLEAGTAQILAGNSQTGELIPTVGTDLKIADFAPQQSLLLGIRYVENLATAEFCPPVLVQLRSQGFGSCLCIPLLVENTPIGELIMASSQTKAFDGEAQEITTEVAAQLAIALQQSRLRQQLQASNEQLQHELNERLQAEAELREQEQLFRSTFNQAAVGIAHVSPNGHWLRVNQKLCDIVGYTREELLQGTFQDITYPDDLNIDLVYFRQMLANEIQTYSMEKRYVRKDNSLVWINLTVSLVREADGQAKYFISVIDDISERKQTELALQRTLKDLADLKFALDQSSIVAITDTRGTITYVNDKFCELSKYSPGELIGQNHRIVNSGYHPKEFFQQMWATISNGQVWQGEIKNRAKDGTFYWVATTIVPFLDGDGKPYQYIAVRSDITTRKAAEADLQKLNITLEQRVTERTAQLEETNQELETFTYSVSHDLRAPLRTMQGFAKALLEDCGDQLDDFCRSYIDSIIDDAVQMNGLINDLLAYSRLTRTQINLQPTSLDEVIESALGQLTAQIQEKQAQIRIVAPLPQVMAHRSTLVQVVANLISNGIKFVESDTSPQIDIFATEEYQNNQGWIKLSIVDNGIGITPEHQERVFRVFERLHGAESYPGTGIGLAIVRKGVERMGGRVGVESHLGHGSCFWIMLPSAGIVQNEPTS
jgi:PAS domain S-box-containing protein